MQTFIGWSGEQSKKIAVSLRKWLHVVFPGISVFVSDTDLLAGQAWAHKISEAIKEATFGILCIDSTNLNSAWLLFEAGALSQAFDCRNVCPLLIDVDRSQLPSPLLTLQSVDATRPGLWSLVVALNSAFGIAATPIDRLELLFEGLWPILENDLRQFRDITRRAERTSDLLHGMERRCSQIAQDLNALLEKVRSGVRNCQVSFSGFAGPIAISDAELQRIAETPKREPEADAMRRERDLLISLAASGCRVRCVISPHIDERLDHTRDRVEMLCNVIDTEKLHTIEWAISAFRQNTTYIIDDISYIEGFKKDVEAGHPYSLRHCGKDVIAATQILYDRIFEFTKLQMIARARGDVLGGSASIVEILRKATRMRLEEILAENEKHLKSNGDTFSMTPEA